MEFCMSFRQMLDFKNVNTRFSKRSFVSVYKKSYHFLKVVRFSHWTRDKASILILEWDIPLRCL
jgi:HKD family nuclease